MRPTTGSPIRPENYFEQFPRPIRATGERVRALVLDALPGVHERYYTGWKLVGYRLPDGKTTRYCCYLHATASRVELGFERGRLLTDPDRVLEGTGTQVRKIVFRSPADVRPAVLRRLLAEAALITKEKFR